MKSYLTGNFLACYGRLPREVRALARQAYRRWRVSPEHPGLQFKRVHTTEPIYSVRIGIGWRVLGLRDGDEIRWFWIGSHADYDTLVSRL